MTRTTSLRTCGTDVDELEPERLDALEHAEQGGLIRDLAAQDGPGRGRMGSEPVERGGQCVTQPAANGDLVVGGLHGCRVGRSRMRRNPTIRMKVGRCGGSAAAAARAQ